jgi:hypothetical protein
VADNLVVERDILVVDIPEADSPAGEDSLGADSLVEDIPVADSPAEDSPGVGTLEEDSLVNKEVESPFTTKLQINYSRI